MPCLHVPCISSVTSGGVEERDIGNVKTCLAKLPSLIEPTKEKKKISLLPEVPHLLHGLALASSPASSHCCFTPADHPTFSWFSFSPSSVPSSFLPLYDSEPLHLLFFAPEKLFPLAYHIANSFFLGSQLKCHPRQVFHNYPS